jgi:hypothetical protein
MPFKGVGSRFIKGASKLWYIAEGIKMAKADLGSSFGRAQLV